MSILFLIASLGVVNGLLLGCYLILKSRRITSCYFGGLLLTLSIRIGKSVFFYFEQDADRLVLQIGLSACIFIGPFFYLYLKALQLNQLKTTRQDIFLLIGLLVGVVTVGMFFPYRMYPIIWNKYLVYGIYAIWIFFTLLGLNYARKVLKELITNPIRVNEKQKYLVSIIIAMLFITSTYQFALFIGFTYIWGALAFTITFYYLSIRALISKKSIVPVVMNQQVLVNGQTIMSQVDKLMITQKPFINQRLKLEELADRIGISKHLLSRVLNENQHGFSNYVKEYRVNEAKQLIATRPELSLEGIGYESGFSSKSSFFEAFKKITNCTPAEYKKSIDVTELLVK